MAGKKCVCCGRCFRPAPQAGDRQKVCGREPCRREHQRRKYRGWVKGHPAHVASRRSKIRAWAKAYPDYWRRKRALNPEYRERERRRMAAKRRAAARVAKQDVMGALAIEKLLAARSTEPKTVVAKQTAVAGIPVEKTPMDAPGGPKIVAKQTAVARRLDLVVDYLIMRDVVANKRPWTGAGPLRDNDGR